MFEFNWRHICFAAFISLILTGTVLYADSPTYKIGVIVPLTGPLAVIGTATKNGIEMACEEQRAATSHLKFIYQDTRSQTTNAVNAYRTLTGSYSAQMIFAFKSETAHAIGPLTERDQMPFLSFAFEPDPAIGKKFMVRPFSPSEHYVQTLLEYLRQESPNQKSYYIVTTEFSFLRSMINAFQDNLKTSEKMVILANVPPEETDFKAVLVRLRSIKPARVGIFLLPHQIASFLKQAAELGTAFDAYGTDFFESAVPLMQDTKLLQGASYPDNYPSEAFRIKYHQRFGNEDQLTFAAAAYAMTLHTARLLSGPQILSGTEIMAAIRQSKPAADSVMGPFHFVSEEKYGQYFKFPIVMKEIRERHGVKLTSAPADQH